VRFLGESESTIDTSKKPTKIMLVGLFGSGKTTTAGKLAKYFSKRGLTVCCLQTDTYRPAAYEQLQQLCKPLNIPIFGNPSAKDGFAIYKEFAAKLNEFDIAIIDTAGRDALSDDLIKELNSMSKEAQPNESLLVISADIGQTAEKQALAFRDACNVTGIIITKLEGTAKGGGALIACSVTKTPVKFVGLGEKIDALEKFNPKGFVSRLLGMGDLSALLEKARDAVTEKEAEDIEAKFMKGKFNLIDLYEQMQAVSKMGPLSSLMEMIPGMGQLKLPKEALKVQEEKLKKWRYMMNSMTKAELEDPDTLSPERIERVAKGSGATAKDVRELLKQYRQSLKMVKLLKPGNQKQMEKMMRKFPGMQGVKF